MNPSDGLHCPSCRGRLTASSDTALECGACGHAVPVRDGIADFIGQDVPAATDPWRYGGDPRGDASIQAGWFDRIRAVAGSRWPRALGTVVELGCGRGELTSALVGSGSVRDLIAVDTDLDVVGQCRDRLAALPARPQRPPLFATLSGRQDVIRDAVADTVIGGTLLSTTGDTRTLLADVHRMLKPGGNALFIAANRRYRQALVQALAEALLQMFNRDAAWPEGCHQVLGMMAQTRRILVHRGDTDFLSNLGEKHLFDSDALEDLAREVGFAAADAIPLEPDPAGSESARRACLAVGAPSETVGRLAPLAAVAGGPFFSLLANADSSALMLLWLTKGTGPRLAVFNARAPAPPIAFNEPATALGGTPPRWSVELTATDTPDGIELAVGGWCLANTDVVWVRITIEDVTLNASVWRPRPDVHEAMNREGMYHPLNALCCGIETEMMFDGVHPVDNRCSLGFAIVLASGVIVSGPAPDSLYMNEQVVISH